MSDTTAGSGMDHEGASLRSANQPQEPEPVIQPMVSVVGGPYDGKVLPITAMQRSIGYPTKYYLRVNNSETAVYAHLSPSVIGYLHTMSDE